MKKTYLTGIAGLVAIGALGAMAYLCTHTEIHLSGTEAQSLAQLSEGATAEITMLKAVLNYLGQWLPNL
ncbi:MAG: hypothetical protein D6772_03475 [Bacteroidetes bacterium]|nr:MAG: hypothetical protein D6772_03475 [Bacteroidota bacterium]